MTGEKLLTCTYLADLEQEYISKLHLTLEEYLDILKQDFDIFKLTFPDIEETALKEIYDLRNCKHYALLPSFQKNMASQCPQLSETCYVNILSEKPYYIKFASSRLFKVNSQTYRAHEIHISGEKLEVYVIPEFWPQLLVHCTTTHKTYPNQRLYLNCNSKYLPFMQCNQTHPGPLAKYIDALYQTISSWKSVTLKNPMANKTDSTKHSSSNSEELHAGRLYTVTVPEPYNILVSPREHLRKGHIRKYKSGKTVFVRETIVNQGKETTHYFS